MRVNPFQPVGPEKPHDRQNGTNFPKIITSNGKVVSEIFLQQQSNHISFYFLTKNLG